MRLLLSLAAVTALTSFAQSGEDLFKSACASCHEGGMDRAPARAALREFSPERVLQAVETGAMVSMASRYNAAQRRTIAEFVTGKTLSDKLVDVPLPDAMCKPGPAPDFSKISWNGWGQGTSNARFQDAANAGIKASDVPKLKVKWAFGFPGEQSVMAQATVVGGRLFIGSPAGKVYSLDTATGCVHWWFQAGSSVRNAVRIENVGGVFMAFFGDQSANVYAVDAATGKQIWKVKADDYPVARVTGSIAYNNGKLFVPVASGEEVASTTPSYKCCKFRGNITALDAATGKQVWKTYSIEETPKPTKKNASATQLYGPSGAPIWSSPTIDTRRNAIYATTGNNYSDPPTRGSNAFLAMDLDTGKLLWSRQMTEQDAYVSACRLPDKTNCPDSNGPDFDFSSGPILVDLGNGRRALVAGQKSGMVHAINPDQQGEVLWQTRVGKGGTMGGVQWGSASDGTNVYVANSDIKRIMLTYSTSTDADPLQGGGMFALRLSDGKQVWSAPPAKCGTRPRCSPAQSAAVTAIPGVAFSGSVDGHMRGYSSKDGKVIWDFDTQREYKTVNGVPGRGGSIDGPGPVISGGMLFMGSGYVGAGGAPGNVLLGLSVDGK